jgi:PPK2 family polyphosphate:nucleotide phosphotransferase
MPAPARQASPPSHHIIPASSQSITTIPAGPTAPQLPVPPVAGILPSTVFRFSLNNFQGSLSGSSELHSVRTTFMPGTHRLTPGKSVKLLKVPTSGHEFHSDREAAEKEFRKLRDELIHWQEKLYAESKQKLLIVLQAMDAGGKDSTIRKVFKGVNPQGVVVTPFKKPTAEELAHDFLWRIHKAVPATGMMSVFNRSHYEDVLVVRVHDIVPESVWRPRYETINQFEKHLTDTGTTILKFFLHISKEEQAERFRDRINNPDKHWKFDHEDLKKREEWDDYQAAFQDMVNHCTTDHAPWYVIPSDQKWYRNVAIARVLIDTLQKMNPQYPQAEDISAVEVV